MFSETNSPQLKLILQKHISVLVLLMQRDVFLLLLDCVFKSEIEFFMEV